jgi:hypothetical protein
LGQKATVCRVLLQQQLSGQFEDVTVPGTLCEESPNSVALGTTSESLSPLLGVLFELCIPLGMTLDLFPPLLSVLFELTIPLGMTLELFHLYYVFR